MDERDAVVRASSSSPARTTSPSGREQLTEYEGNKLIVAVDRDEPDALGARLAYRLRARPGVAMARDRELEVDAAGVRDAAEEAVSAAQAGARRSA